MRNSDATKPETTAFPSTLEAGLSSSVKITPNGYDTSTTETQETTRDFFDNEIFDGKIDVSSTSRSSPDYKPTVEYSTRVTSSITSSTSFIPSTATTKKEQTTVPVTSQRTTIREPTTILSTSQGTTTRAPTTIPVTSQRTTARKPSTILSTIQRSTTNFPSSTPPQRIMTTLMQEIITTTQIPDTTEPATTTESFVAKNYRRLQLLLAAQNARQKSVTTAQAAISTESSTFAFTTLEPSTERSTTESTTRLEMIPTTLPQKSSTIMSPRFPFAQASTTKKPKPRAPFSDAEDLAFLV